MKNRQVGLNEKCSEIMLDQTSMGSIPLSQLLEQMSPRQDTQDTEQDESFNGLGSPDIDTAATGMTSVVVGTLVSCIW